MASLSDRLSRLEDMCMMPLKKLEELFLREGITPERQIQVLHEGIRSMESDHNHAEHLTLMRDALAQLEAAHGKP